MSNTYTDNIHTCYASHLNGAPQQVIVSNIEKTIENNNNTQKIKRYQESIIKSLTKFSTTCEYMERKLAEEEVRNGENN